MERELKTERAAADRIREHACGAL